MTGKKQSSTSPHVAAKATGGQRTDRKPLLGGNPALICPFTSRPQTSDPPNTSRPRARAQRLASRHRPLSPSLSQRRMLLLRMWCWKLVTLQSEVVMEEILIKVLAQVVVALTEILVLLLLQRWRRITAAA